jgi:hypothetical protein
MILGVIIGGVFAAVENLTPPHLPDLLVVSVFAAILILVSAPFLRSTVQGLVCGVVALVTRTVAVFLYIASIYGADVSGAVLPYSFLFLYGLVLYPIVGALAGYLSRRLEKW